MKRHAKRSSLRVKREAIEELQLSRQETPLSHHVPCVLRAGSAFAPVAPFSANNDGSGANISLPATKQEPVFKELDEFKNHWNACRTWLSVLWDTKPAVPSLKSRSAWANAHGIPPSNLHSWFGGKKQARRKKNLPFYPTEGYEMAVDEPRELLVVPLESLPGFGGEPNLASATPNMGSSLAPSSPPHTPWDLQPVIAPTDIVDRLPSTPAWCSSSIKPPVPFNVKGQPFLHAVSFPPHAGSGNVGAFVVSAQVNSVDVMTEAKRGEKRKVLQEVEFISREEESSSLRSKHKEKCRKVEKTKVQTEPPESMPLPNTGSRLRMSKALTVSQSIRVDQEPELRSTPKIQLSKASKKSIKPLQELNKEPSPVSELPTCLTVSPHTFAAQVYTAILVAPLISDKPSDKALGPYPIPAVEPKPSSVSAYTTKKLPPLPAFEALNDPAAFLKDCKEALRVSLQINSDLNLWDPVVESLPMDYFTYLGASAEMDWNVIELE